MSKQHGCDTQWRADSAAADSGDNGRSDSITRAVQDVLADQIRQSQDNSFKGKVNGEAALSADGNALEIPNLFDSRAGAPDSASHELGDGAHAHHHHGDHRHHRHDIHDEEHRHGHKQDDTPAEQSGGDGSAQDRFSALDKNGDGMLDFSEFSSLYGDSGAETLPAGSDQLPIVNDGVQNHQLGQMVGLDKMPVGLINSNYTTLYDNPQNMSVEFLKEQKDMGIGGIQSIYYLPLDRPLNDQELSFLNRDFQNAQEAGMKLVPRFVYAPGAGDPDAPQEQILAHMKQLAPILSANENTIGLIDMGFVGAWGEWNRSTSNPLNDKDFDLQKKMYDIYSAAIPNTPIAFSHADTLREMFGDNNLPNNVMLFNDSIGKQNGATSENNDSGEFYQPGDYEWAQQSRIMYTGENQQVGTPELVLQRIKDLNITSMKLWGPVGDAIQNSDYLQKIQEAMKENAVESGIPV